MQIVFKQAQENENPVAKEQCNLFILDSLRIIYLKQMKYNDFEAFLDGILSSTYNFQNGYHLTILKPGDVISYTQALLESKPSDYDSDSEEELVVQFTDAEKIARKLILYKVLAKTVTAGITDSAVSENALKEVVYAIQPQLNKLINLKECKEKLLILNNDGKSQAPTAEACRNTFTFISTLLELFSSAPAVAPSTFNVGHYVPIWLSF